MLWIECFPPAVWNRGVELAQRGVVDIDHAAVNEVRAIVRPAGEPSQRVVIGFDPEEAEFDDGFAVSCTCLDCRQSGLCSHIAAVLIEADRLGHTANWDITQDPMIDWESAFNNEVDPRYQIPALSQTVPSGPPVSAWKRQLAQIGALQQGTRVEVGLPPANPKERRLIYVVDLERSKAAKNVVIEMMYQAQLKDGSWGAAKATRQTLEELQKMHGPEDQTILERLIGGNWVDTYYMYYRTASTRTGVCQLPQHSTKELLALLCATGRCWLAVSKKNPDPSFIPLTWEGEPPWQFQVDWRHDDQRKAWVASGRFQRTRATDEVETLTPKAPLLVLDGGILIYLDRIASLAPLGSQAAAWRKFLVSNTELVVPDDEFSAFSQQFYRAPTSGEIELPEEHRWVRIEAPPAPSIRLREFGTSHKKDMLLATVRFHYDDFEVQPSTSATSVADEPGQRLIVRDITAENRRFGELRASGFRQAERYYSESDTDLQLPRKKLPHAVAALTRLGWQIEAQGVRVRRPGKFNISVTSGVDWFDLNVACDFDGVKAALPDLLKAIEKGDPFVVLGDGTHGILPEEWLKKYAPLAEFGKTEGDSLKFLPSQALILDALLAAQPDADIDATFCQVREKLRSFDGVRAEQEPASFQGTLRTYQREGLGWMNFLHDFRFGGCLADDMGLGKTVQVLALLEGMRTGSANGKKKSAARPPSLVVAPKSLVFNWVDEAARFAPQLKVLNYTGLDRKSVADSLADYDLVVTTYGTLRKDILKLNKQRFQYAILDEAQAIKNPGSQAAKACRLLQAEHRLAMTGTPVENHLGDLWSLFEFLNPGMLGRSDSLAAFSGRKNPDAESVDLLARALRPFLLRRTKEQVLKELPEKTEQTLYCEMEPKQRKLYDHLRDYYRTLLAKKIKDVGLAKAKIHVLEALLRLRQAACHPALIDKDNAKLPSAKLDTLLEQLTEVIEEHHKVLVFSQFTSFLSLVKPVLKKNGIPFEYLDGQTHDRKACVERFQNDPDCRVFLISLKAGGHGLNLTAADYVFILDPWWNPAVEMQAVDRAHRIGQTRPVFAYRLIARDTVEEKILELQKQKRTLAEAVISADENLLRTLTAEDLQMLLS